MAQSADRLITKILRSVGPDTYVVLTSDNGFHLGQNGLGRGKGTAYDTDVRVPLLVTGPGVVPGSAQGGHQQHRPRADLRGAGRAARRRPTAAVSRSSRRSTQPALVRQSYAFLEHTQQTLTGGDPDAAFSGAELDRIPSYTAVRSRTRAAGAARPRPAAPEDVVGLRVLQLPARTAGRSATRSPARSASPRSTC